MSCKICGHHYRFGSNSPENEYLDYSLCYSCYEEFGFDIIFERKNEELQEVEEKWEKIIIAKIDQYAGAKL